ncbi:MAG: cyclic nucleotide-binding domain-containing protein [Mariprofundaceae bacterium]|nr:cyclic nucleotide-binding domain-containing protein [Mariprofundaceae bacterium]
MARTLHFHKGDILINQGDDGDSAYLIQEGWLQVLRKGMHRNQLTSSLGPGEIAGELALTGVARKRTATVRALTDGCAEIIDRGVLIRLVNGPGTRLMPLLGALFTRLQDSLVDPVVKAKSESVSHAVLSGINDKARRTLCNTTCCVSQLPWVFGAYMHPVSVTELFGGRSMPDVRLPGEDRKIREHHLQIEARTSGGLQLRIMNHGDYCMLDEQRIGYCSTPDVVELSPGKHAISFGQISDPYVFAIEVPETED